DAPGGRLLRREGEALLRLALVPGASGGVGPVPLRPGAGQGQGRGGVHRARRRLPERGRLAQRGARGAGHRRAGGRGRPGGGGGAAMSKKDAALEQYRRQLNEWVAALAVADNEAVCGDVAEGYAANDVHLFTEGNLDKRADILDLQLSFLKPAFEDLDELIGE